MTDTPDLQALARRYLDLWQDRMAALANDPQLAETMAKSFAAMGDGVTAMAEAMAMPTSPADQHKDAHAAHHGDSGEAAGRATASADPSAQLGLDTAELARRIAELEARVAGLESALDGAKPGPVRRTGRRRL